MKTESKGLTWFSHITMFLFAAACLIPFILLISASLTDQSAIIAYGYSFIPQSFSTEAYEYLYQRWSDIGRAYGVSIFITVVGTSLGLVIMALLAYPLSRSVTPHRNLIMFFVFFTLLFHGGMVPSYLVYTQIFHVKNTIWALIIPMLMNGFFIMLMRTFFQSTIPPALLEAAQLDGAGEFRTLWSVVLPLSTPVMATLGLFQSIFYWNDWQLGMMYITKPSLFSIQNLLNRMMEDINFIQTNISSSQAGEALQQMPSDSVKMAIAVIGVLPILLAYPFFQKYFVKGIMIGAVKG